MKIKIIFASIAFTILTAITLSQVIGVNAQSAQGQPITSPNQTPTPTPITPISYIVGGKVQYRFLNLLGKIINIVPAQNLTVKTINKSTNEVKSVKTNAQGVYSIILKKGTYRIQAINVNNGLFMPDNLTASVSSNINGLDFYKNIEASTR